jgi:hypothetical protein
MQWTSIIPITVVAAFFLFVTKEMLEWFKRASADKRKIAAIKILLARECELNKWTLLKLRQAVTDIKDTFEEKDGIEYAIERIGSDKIIFKEMLGEERRASWPLPPTYTDAMGKQLLDTAILDKRLFANLEGAYDAVLEMRHVRDSVIEYVESRENVREMHLEAFSEYALDELNDTEESLKTLYNACTGKPLDSIRLR